MIPLTSLHRTPPSPHIHPPHLTLTPSLGTPWGLMYESVSEGRGSPMTFPHRIDLNDLQLHSLFIGLVAQIAFRQQKYTQNVTMA